MKQKQKTSSLRSSISKICIPHKLIWLDRNWKLETTTTHILYKHKGYILKCRIKKLTTITLYHDKAQFKIWAKGTTPDQAFAKLEKYLLGAWNLIRGEYRELERFYEN